MLERVGKSKKKFSICFIGVEDMQVPANASLSAELRTTAENALGGRKIAWVGAPPAAADLAGRVERGRNKIQGLFSGGTMCAEAQVFLRRAGVPVASNVPIPGVKKPAGAASDAHTLLDLGDVAGARQAAREAVDLADPAWAERARAALAATQGR